MPQTDMIKLQDVALIRMGQSPDSRYYNGEGIGLPFLQGCAQFGEVDPYTSIYCSVLMKIAPKGSILFSVRAPVGEINVADRDYIIGRGLAAVIAENIKPELLYYLLSFAKPQLQRIAQGSTFEAISSSDLAECKLPDLGGKPEQAKIAGVLTAVDQTIAQTEVLIAKYRRIKTGLMQDLLTRGIDENGRLRDPATHEFKEVEGYGRVPKEWQVKILNEVAEIGSGITLGRNIDGHNVVELPYLRVANVQDGYLDLSEVKTVKVYQHEVEKYLLQPGDVLMNEGGDYDKLGRGTVWNGQITPCLHQNHVFRVRTIRAELLPEYLALFSESPYGKQFFILNSKQSTNLASINSTQLKAFPIPSPNLDEQERIVATLSTYENQIQKEHSFLQKLKRIKAGLMQDLLTGKVSIAPLLDGPGT